MLIRAADKEGAIIEIDMNGVTVRLIPSSLQGDRRNASAPEYERHVVTAYVQEPGRSGVDVPLSTPRSIPSDVSTTPRDTAGGLSADLPRVAGGPQGKIAQLRVIDNSAAAPDPIPQGRTEAEARIAKPENYKALAEQYRVDPETGTFDEEADLRRLAQEGKLTRKTWRNATPLMPSIRTAPRSASRRTALSDCPVIAAVAAENAGTSGVDNLATPAPSRFAPCAVSGCNSR